MVSDNEREPSHTDETDQSEAATEQFPSASPVKPGRSIPTSRGSFKTQRSILKGYGAAAKASGGLVKLDDVADACGLSRDTVSVCNEFFKDTGLLHRQGRRFKPSPEVLEFVQACQWNEDTAGHKFADLMRVTWFGQAVLPRLTVRSLPRSELVDALALEAGASIKHKPQVAMLLDYLEFSGLIRQNGDLVELAHPGNPDADPPPSLPTLPPPQTQEDPEGLENFSIQLPGHLAATLSIPKSLSEEDWQMLSGMIDLYIKRLNERFRKNEPGTGPGS